MANGIAENILGRLLAEIPIAVSATTDFGTSSISVFKIGNTVSFDFRTYDASNIHNVTPSTVLFTLPEGYRPNRTLHFTGIGNKTADLTEFAPVFFTISTNGNLTCTYNGNFYQLWIAGNFPIKILP